MSDIVERLRDIARAYPEDIFPPFTEKERREHSVIISQASGNMGRFLSKHMQEAAAEIERLRIEIAALRAAITHPHGTIGIGDQVHKVAGYLWPGEVRAVFTTRAGRVRYVVECTVPEVEGALHIYAGEQIAKDKVKP